MAKLGESDTHKDRCLQGTESRKKKNTEKRKTLKEKQLLLKRDRIQNLDVVDGQTVHGKATHITQHATMTLLKS